MQLLGESLQKTLGKIPATANSTPESHGKFQRRLAAGVLGWMRFEFSCGRGYLFEEKSLIHPVASVVGGRKFCTVFNEVAHPTLRSANNYPKLDFVACRGDQALLGIETKFAGWSATTGAEVLHDLHKLAAFNTATGAPALLLIAGLAEVVKQSRISWPANLSVMKGSGFGTVTIAEDVKAKVTTCADYYDANDVPLSAVIWRVDAPKVKQQSKKQSGV